MGRSTKKLEALESGSETLWRTQYYEPAIAEQGERKTRFQTQSLRWDIKPLYTQSDLDAIGFDPDKDLGLPGTYPYTRETRPAGYRGDLWAMTQVSGFGCAEDSAKRWEYMVNQGLDSIIVEYDLPTTNGYDSDNPLCRGEVGRAGMALDTLQDMEEALNFPLEKLKNLTSVCNAPQPVNLAMLIKALQRKGKKLEDIRLMMPNTILVEYTCVGRYIYPPKHGLRLACDVIEYCMTHHKNWMPLNIVGAQIYAARGNPVQEIAYSFAMARAYIDELLARGHDINEVAPMVSFITGIDMDFFEAIGKLRAYRKVWARLMKETYGATAEEALKLRLMSSPGTMSMALQQPLNNIARLGIEMLACALGGGAHTINTPLYDEAHALPSEDAITIGANIHHIVAQETGVADTIDPLAGSYYVEYMTKRMEDAVFEEMEKIEAMGGALGALEAGYFQSELAEEQIAMNSDFHSGERKFVGVNYLVKKDEKREIEIFRHDEEAEARQIERLNRIKAQRDNAAVERVLEKVREAARGNTNMVEPMLEAVELYATHGELCDAMRDVFGEYDPNALTPTL
ncbi:methylmalonyl-CoA mutase family protein [Litorivivens sp.]|uniref:methylmalonyl-CoA mutase family protein n=1 Tax=Litorivivens sp. TaxID=2020868 RepID=UPI0035688450